MYNNYSPHIKDLPHAPPTYIKIRGNWKAGTDRRTHGLGLVTSETNVPFSKTLKISPNVPSIT